MRHKHALSRTTHTVEMTQIAELNDQLASRRAAEAISAGDLGLGNATVHLGVGSELNRLPVEAILERLSWDGSPEFPYVHAHFRTGPAVPAELTVDLHTLALRQLSQLLHVRVVWGVGSA